MNNTRTLAVSAILAVTLVVGTFAATTTTQSAYAYKKGDKGNGNTDTIQACLQKGIQSGFDNTFEQECQNLILTHPVKTCEQCFTSLLTPTQILIVTHAVGISNIELFCALLVQSPIPIEVLQDLLRLAGVSASVQAQLIQCLLNAGITFATRPG